MRSSFTPAALLALALAVSPSTAQQQYCPPRPIYVPQAPNACGPGFYSYNEYGALYGPNYALYPPFHPFQGMIPLPQCKGKPGANGGGGSVGMPKYPGPQGGPGGYPGSPGGPGAPPQMLGSPESLRTLALVQQQPEWQALARLQGLPPLPGLPALPPVPGMPPYQGIPGIAQPPRYISHPFARSPRDFFMLD